MIVNQAEGLVAQVASFLNAHSRQPITVQDLADQFSYSPAHLTRLFTSTVGASPIRYLAALRFQQAKRLLVEDGAGVLDACHQVGYASPGTFARRFLADVGLPPGQFRKAADRVAESELSPVTIGPEISDRVRVRLDVPSQIAATLGPFPYQWIGTFPGPVPSGPPTTGSLRRGIVDVELRILWPGQWLLAMVSPSGAGLEELLWPSAPLVAGPVSAPMSGEVVLPLRIGRPWDYPVMPALAALHPRILEQ